MKLLIDTREPERAHSNSRTDASEKHVIYHDIKGETLLPLALKLSLNLKIESQSPSTFDIWQTGHIFDPVLLLPGAYFAKHRLHFGDLSETRG